MISILSAGLIVTPGGSIALDTVPTGGDVAIVSRLFDNSRILSFIIIGIGAGIIIVLKARKDKSAKKRMAGGGKMASPIHESHGYVRPIIPVCVLIPAYNEEGFIGETLESLMDQTVCPKNIIVIDDCSTDRTTEIAKSFGVTVTRTRANTGSKANALNYGMIIVDKVYSDH